MNDTDIIKKPNKLDEIKNIGKRFILLTEFIFSNIVIVHQKFLSKNSFFNIILETNYINFLIWAGVATATATFFTFIK